MTENEKQIEGQTRRQKIAERYKGVDPSVLEVIPAEMDESINITEQKLKVAAYVRVSTENDEQKSSFELQSNDFTNRINANPNWEFVDIYADEGISGTEMSHRKGMLQMIEDCRAGKINLILAKSIARFARNVVDCLSVIEELRNLNPPVGVYFDESNLYTLDTSGALVLTILATVAEEESRSKSFIMNWSVEKRFSNGIFLLPEPIGFDKDADGNLAINPDEAETVKVMYDLFINGWSLQDIADLLTEYRRPTKKGNTVWSTSSILNVLDNERNCGDVLARKTFTPNFKDHKSKRNVNQRNKYRQRDHHKGIVDRDVYEAAQIKRRYMTTTKGGRALPVLSVVDDGVLKGYVPLHKNWTGFSGDTIRKASESVLSDELIGTEDRDGLPSVRPLEKQFSMEGFREISGMSFYHRDKPHLRIRKGRLFFSTYCLQKFRDVEYVEFLVNPIEKYIAIRPTDVDNPNAIHWGKLRDGKWAALPIGCPGIVQVLGDLMDWEEPDSLSCIGEFFEEEKLLLFSLGDSVVHRAIVPERPDDPGTEKQEDPDDSGETSEQDGAGRETSASRLGIYSQAMLTALEVPFTSVATVSLLERKHYAGDWEVLRPARELKEMNTLTTERLSELMREAESIIEGWTSCHAEE
ncbi:MAG: recombinase family protein [Clostridia bacterium]|nr:recombinase family protein [Clostridia bacterium]